MNAFVHGSNGQSQAADLHVQEVIRSAERELHELLQRRAELMKRIGTIKQTLAGLANILATLSLTISCSPFSIARPRADSLVSPGLVEWS